MVVTGQAPAATTRRPLLGRRTALLIAGVAVAVRLLPVLLGGGLTGYGRYDDGVYYAAADSLTFGRLPYRDFVLLHPPGLMLVLAPFALLGRLTTDAAGMGVGRLFFIGVGATNAVLVGLIAARWHRRAGIIAALLYAAMMPAVYSEQSTILEPLGGTALLVALFLLLRTRRSPTLRTDLLAGVALGLGATLKIWYLATWGFVVAWQLLARRGWSALRILASGIVAALAVVLPFFVLAPRQMFQMILRDQLARATTAAGPLQRLSSILGLRIITTDGHVLALLVTVVGLAVVALAAACCREPAGRTVVALLAMTVIVLMVSPPYYAHYAAYSAAPLALVVGIGSDRVASSPGLTPVTTRLVIGVVAVVIAALGIRVITIRTGLAFPSRVTAAAPAGCVTSDDPTALIAMDRLSTDLRAHCRVPVDVTGITYDTLHRPVPREKNKAFQRWLYDYLVSGRSFVLARRRDAGEALRTRSRLEAHPLLAHGGHVSLWLSAGSSTGVNLPAGPVVGGA